MNRRIFAFALLIVCGSVAFISGCKKDKTSEPLEPISLVKPDSAISRQFPGDKVPYELKFTTDRPINWVMGVVDVDTLIDSTVYTPTYPDTLFLVKLDGLDPRVNLYTLDSSYTVSDTLRPYTVIRFRISYEAGNTGFVTGQNFPAGKVSATKEFKINVR